MDIRICARKLDGHSDLYQASRWTRNIDRGADHAPVRHLLQASQLFTHLRFINRDLSVHLLSWYKPEYPSTFMVHIGMSIHFPGTNRSVHLLS